MSTVAQIVKETCEAIWDVLKDSYMPVPDRKMWLSNSKRFEERWNFPHCIGALDGKHVVIQSPPNSGSLFYNYKHTFSVVLMAMVDADYKCICIDVGGYGGNSDGGIFANSNLGRALQAGQLDVPPPSPLPSAADLGPLPYVAVGDEAFPMKPYLLRPYSGRRLPEDLRVFNYRLSRARRIVENAFAILRQRWRIYTGRVQLAPDTADSVIKATCMLHNFLRCATMRGDDPGGELDYDDDEEDDGEGILRPLRNLRGNHASAESQRIRDAFCKHFSSSAGEVSWQYGHVNRGRRGQHT